MRIGMIPTILVLWILPLTILVAVEIDWDKRRQRRAKRGRVSFTSDRWQQIARQIYVGRR